MTKDEEIELIAKVILGEKVKVVINRQHGGFGLSEEAWEWLIEKKGWRVEASNYRAPDPLHNRIWTTGEPHIIVDGGANRKPKFLPRYHYYGSSMHPKLRSHLDVIECVETLGVKANNKYCTLKIVEIPAGVEFEIGEYDGLEWIAEKHRIWS